MRLVPISKIREHVNAVAQTTKNGMPAAVLVSADAWRSLKGTLYGTPNHA
jgi:prevent-host-death family protein